jgi:aldehyde:ferredoxin oxidoreductase
MHMEQYRALDVDLASGETKQRVFAPDLTRAYLGGGLAARLLTDETSPETDPLAPESVMCLFGGLLTATGVPSASKLSVCARSPLTGIWGESTVGGDWPAKLRATGFDGIILRGRADGPVVVRVEEDGAHIDSAIDLWGKDTFETYDALAERYPGCAAACIGPGGEGLLPIASFAADGRIARMAGRGGMGAVLGSKNVKAIVARGSKRPELADRAALRDMVRADSRVIAEKATRLREWGTAGGVIVGEVTGDLPIKNWALGTWSDGAEKTTAQTFYAKYLEKHHTCNRCPIRCGKLMRQDSGPYAGSVAHGPEYETLAGFGANCMVDDIAAIMAANEYCNRAGIDTISASGLVAFAMEAYERGIITKDDIGRELRWGDGQAVLDLLRDMVEGTGLGGLLAKGVREAARVLGKGSEEFAVHVKGLELPLHDPRAYTSMAPSYALASRGGCHLDALSYVTERGVRLEGYGFQGELDPRSDEHKAQVAHENMKYFAVFNALGLCKFLMVGRTTPVVIARWMKAVTGWEVTPDELLETAERLITIKRLYNLERGITAADDILPARLMQPKPDGAAEGVVPNVAGMVKQIYEWRGWDERGVPKPETLERLGLVT